MINDDRDIYNVELKDAHFSNEEVFSSNGGVSFSLDFIAGNEKVQKTVSVSPKESKEHKFEPAAYSYTLEKSSSSSAIVKGVTSNKPISAEILTKRDFILTSGWHCEQWTTFLVLSLLTVGLPYGMWKS